MQPMGGFARMIRAAVFLCLAPLAYGETHFHHVHINSINPEASLAFYSSRFSFKAGTVLRFNRVEQPPPHEIESAIWHIGWGAENMKAEYDRQLKLETPFDTPITELFANFFYAYVRGPGNELIELNTARHHEFGHIHLLSADPVSAGEWYVKNLGAVYRSGRPPAREPSFIRGFQIGPNASLMIDNVNIIIFPIEYARQYRPQIWKDRTTFDSPRGRVIDHIAFEADTVPSGGFITGPDNIAIEIVAKPKAKSYPEFTHGEECLFCHRNTIGPSWQTNAHNVTTRPEGDGFVVGMRRARQLKKTGYNKFDLADDATPNKFMERCAGCHTTAVDPEERTFAYYGLDCFTCHGPVDLKHSADTKLVLLSKKNREGVNQICGSCHLRGGKSKTTGRPYPNVFVPGENLFEDFTADSSRTEDAHVIRDANCLDCHSIHGNSSQKHRRAASAAICNDCHYEGQPRKQVRAKPAHSVTCEY